MLSLRVAVWCLHLPPLFYKLVRKVIHPFDQLLAKSGGYLLLLSFLSHCLLVGLCLHLVVRLLICFLHLIKFDFILIQLRQKFLLLILIS